MRRSNGVKIHIRKNTSWLKNKILYYFEDKYTENLQNRTCNNTNLIKIRNIICTQPERISSQFFIVHKDEPFFVFSRQNDEGSEILPRRRLLLLLVLFGAFV